MEKYSLKTQCPKCGCEHLMSKFMSWKQYALPDGAEGLIQRECTNCSYQFFQLPLDSKEPDSSAV